MKTKKMLSLAYPLLVLCFLSETNGKESPPRGHMEPLGNHKDPEGHIDVLTEMPTPQDFWDKYCSIGRPVLLKGAALGMPAMTKWSDEYLLKNYGDLMVKLESKNEKEHKPEGSKGMGQDTIKHFVNTYIQHDKYMVSQLPDPMTAEVIVPRCVLCGTFHDHILEANMWMSSGNTNSLLHRDADNALNCLLNGTKNWILIDPVHEEMLPVAIEPGTPYGGFTLIDVQKVDLMKFPKFRDVPWYYANISAGDCLFLPKGHWHQVRSYGSKNVAVSILLARITEFEPYGCPEKGLPESKKLSEVPMVWTYDGYSAQTMGNTDPFELNETINDMCEENGNILTTKVWVIHLQGSLEVEETHYKGTQEINKDEWETTEDNLRVIEMRAAAIMKLLDPSRSGTFYCKNLHKADVEMLKKIADILDPDPANTDEYEFIHTEPETIKRAIMKSMFFSEKKFKKIYKKLQGSDAGMEWIFNTLDDDANEQITATEVLENLDKVLERFSQVMLKDIGQSRVSETPNRDEL